MAASNADRRAALRSAIEGLLRTCVDLDRQADDTGRESQKHVHRVANQLVGLRLPGMKNLADDVAGLGKLMNTDVSRALADARKPYVAEIHELLSLLAPLHGLGPIPSPAVAPSNVGLGEQFPPGFAQTYMRDLLASVSGSMTMVADEAGHVRIVTQAETDAAAVAAGGGFSEEHREQGVQLLQGSTSHAVERHGPQIPAETQLARLIWLKDPVGAYTWQILATGAVATNHRCGVASGGFTSPEALAKPLDALLRHARVHAGGFDEFLDSNVAEGVDRIGIHVSAEQAALAPGDTSGFRGSGTGTRETRRDWIAARRRALSRGDSPVYGVAYDPIADGGDPGATLVFKRADTGWQLVTCYPVEQQDPMNKRLEDFR